MKKFIITVSFYIVVLSICIVVLNKIYVNKRVDSSDIAKFDYVPDGIQVCNFGSSHGLHDYYYVQFDDEYVCFNFALDSQQLSYDARILDCYQDKLAKGAVVIIDISYFTFWGIPEDQTPDFQSKNKRYYRFLPKQYIKDYALFEDLVVRVFPIMGDGFDDVLKTLFCPKEEYEYKDSCAHNYYVVDMNSIIEDANGASGRHIVNYKRDENNNLIVNNEEIEALRLMVDICRKHDAFPVIIIPPYLKEYTDSINETDPYFFPEFYEMVNKLCNELDVKWYDYAFDDEFINEYSFFYNSDHMNSVGAEHFTKRVFDEIIVDR